MIRRLIGNAGTNLGQLFVRIVVTFIMAPIYLKMMGHYDYGLREIVMAVGGYMGLLSLGMGPTITRFVSMHYARGERQAVLTVYSCSFFFMFLVGAIIAGVFWLWGIFFPHTIGGSEGGVYKYMAFLMVVGVQFLFVFPMNVTIFFLEGLQLFYLKNIINIFFTIAVAGICYIYMTPSNALLLLVGVTTVSAIVRLIVFTRILSTSSVGRWNITFTNFSFAKLKEMLLFGSKSFVQGVSSEINDASDRVVIGSIIGPAAVPTFTIPMTLLGYVNNITMTITQVFMPMFSDLSAKGQIYRMREIYLLASKYVVSVTVAMCVGMSVVGGPFIEIWMPGEFDMQVVNGIVILLACYMALHRLNPFYSHFLTAVNRHGFLAKIMPIGAFVNLAVSIWMVFQIGVLGAAIGTIVPVFFLVPAALIYCCRNLGIAVTEYIQCSIFPAFLPVLAMSSIIIWLRLEWGLTSYTRLVLCILCAVMVFFCVFLLVSCDKEEKALWIRHLRAMVKPRT